MEIVRIAGLSICGVILALVLKEQKPFLGVVLGMLTATAAFSFLLPIIGDVLLFAKDLLRETTVGQAYFKTLLKIAGIASLSRIAAEICKDAGFSAVSSVVFMSGRVLCAAVCIPQVAQLLNVLTELLP